MGLRQWWKGCRRSLKGAKVASRWCRAVDPPRLQPLEERVLPANWQGDITADTTWHNNEIQFIVGDVHVLSGVTLTIEPNTIIKVNYGPRLTVDGKLVADGAAGQKIIFTSYRDDSAG